MSPPKRVLIIAGPNGAGKTTLATEFLPNEADCPRFINADLIAAGISPFQAERYAVRAGRLMIQLIREAVDSGDSFAFETTLSGRAYTRLIPIWREDGYQVKLIFLRLDTPELAVSRVRQRVAEGGHNVAEHVVRRRYFAGWRNFETVYRDLVDEWVMYDNSGDSWVLVKEGSSP